MTKDGAWNRRYHFAVTLTDQQEAMLRRVAKARGERFHDVLYACFVEGLEALGQRLEDELADEGGANVTAVPEENRRQSADSGTPADCCGAGG